MGGQGQNFSKSQSVYGGGKSSEFFQVPKPIWGKSLQLFQVPEPILIMGVPDPIYKLHIFDLFIINSKGRWEVRFPSKSRQQKHVSCPYCEIACNFSKSQKYEENMKKYEGIMKDI